MEMTYTSPRQATVAIGLRRWAPDHYWVAPSGTLGGVGGGGKS